MSNTASKVLIASEIDKVPPELRSWFDPQQPLPAEVLCCEEQQTLGDHSRKLFMSIGLIVVGILLVVFGLVLIILPVVGLVLIFDGLMLLNSVRTERQALAAQQTGQHLRYGVFLSPGMLAIHTAMDHSMIPNGEDVQTTDGKLYYMLNGEKKNLPLPRSLVGQTAASLAYAIQKWTAKTA